MDNHELSTFRSADYEALPEDDRAPSSGLKRHISGRQREITCHVLILCVPMLVFSTVLLYFVLFHSVTHDVTGLADNGELMLASDHNEPGVYFVNVSATRLIFIASWSSSLAPLLVTSMATLWSYRIAREMAQQSRASTHGRLPTPFQLGLTLSMLTGSVLTSLYKWGSYSWTTKKSKQPQGHMLRTTGIVLFVGSIVSILVLLADTWLHLQTRTVVFLRSTPVSNLPKYSFALLEGCTKGNNSAAWTASNTDPASFCSLNIGRKAYLNQPKLALSTLNNVSNVSTVYQYDSATPYTFLGPPEDADLKRTDYEAKTYGLQTTCTSATRSCDLLSGFGPNTPFHCSDSFSGDVSKKTWNMVYFNDSSMVNNSTWYGSQNPFNFGWAALVNEDMGTLQMDGIVGTQQGGTGIVVLCNTSVYDIAYTSVNGTIRNFLPTMSNLSVSNIVASNMAETSIARDYLRFAAAMSVGVTARNAKDLADQLALSYSKAALAVFSNSIVPSAVPHARYRSSILVARVPDAPLYALLAANLAFVVAGFVLCCLALRDSQPAETRDVQARLSITGLVADHFEQPQASRHAKDLQDVFGEFDGKDVRVGMRRAKGRGWEYCVLATEREGPS